MTEAFEDSDYVWIMENPSYVPGYSGTNRAPRYKYYEERKLFVSAVLRVFGVGKFKVFGPNQSTVFTFPAVFTDLQNAKRVYEEEAEKLLAHMNMGSHVNPGYYSSFTADEVKRFEKYSLEPSRVQFEKYDRAVPLVLAKKKAHEDYLKVNRARRVYVNHYLDELLGAN